MQILHICEIIFENIVEWSVLLVECIGVVVLMMTIIKCFIGYWKKNEHVRLELAEGTALALSFKLGGEVLRTLIVREWSELLILGAIIVLRSAMAFLIHWEIKTEKKDNI
ncbi:MAG: DUF1622 domain-containing protein [bacterium]|nr:DUF1622 domain-containing protein [bacterium]